MKTELTALDHFAIAALPAIASSDTLLAINDGNLTHKEKWALESFAIAEAMLAESEKRNRSI